MSFRFRFEGISVEENIPPYGAVTAAHIWLLSCQTQIVANIVQFSFILFTIHVMQVVGLMHERRKANHPGYLIFKTVCTFPFYAK